MPYELVHLTANVVDKPRFAVMEGRDYAVLPVVILMEGVHVGNNGPVLYMSEDMEKFAPAWNHKPIVVYHPKINGQFVSADSPAILTTSKVGVLMANQVKDGKQHAEAWLEKSRVKEVDDRILTSMENGEPVEVSIGLFTDNEEKEGTWNGEDYFGIARNYRPDHLALLPDLTGACSLKDGCGLFTNEEEPTLNEEVFKSLGLTINPVHSCSRDGSPGYQWGSQKCYTYSKGDESARKQAKRKAYIQGAAVGANALLEDLETKYEPPEAGTLPAGGKKILSRVYTNCRKTNPEWSKERCSKVAWGAVKNAGYRKDAEGTWHKPETANEVVDNEMSHDEVRYELQKTLYGDPQPSRYINDVFDDYFIYSEGDNYYKQKYKLTKDGVEVVGDPQEVKREMVYSPTDNGGSNMGTANCDCPEVKSLVDGLISANKDWKEDDRKWLLDQDKATLNKLTTMQEAKPEPKAKPAAKAEPEEEPEEEEVVVHTPEPKPKKKALSLEDHIKQAPKPLQEVLASGVQAHFAEKKRLTDIILTNETNQFSEDESKSFELPMLRKLAALAVEKEDENKHESLDLFNYIGGVGAPQQTANAQEEHLPLPTMNFKKDK